MTIGLFYFAALLMLTKYKSFLIMYVSKKEEKENKY